MRIGRMVLASAAGMGATVGWAWGQQQQPPPLPATTPAAAQATGGADVAGLAQGIRQAADPSRAVAAYTAAVARVGTDVAVEDAYVRRMVEFNLPDMAESQAQDLLERDPNNDVARAVLAYMQGRRGQAVDALGTIVQAAGGDRVVTDPFILHTAGQLVAWYDTRADKGTIPERLKANIEAMRKKLSAQDEYGLAYGAARDAYQGRAPAGAAETGEGQVAAPEASVPASTYDSNAQPMASMPDESVVSPITPYDDSYVSPYTYGYTGAYYYPYNYWPRYYRRPFYPSYVPPIIIPRHHHDHDGDHDGHGHHGDGDHDHDHGHDHDGDHDHDHDHGRGGGGGSHATPDGNLPRVHLYDDMHRSRNRSETPALAPRAIEPPSPQIVGGRVPPPESTGRTYQRMQQADRPTPAPVPRTERRADPPAGGSSVRTAPRVTAQDRSGGGAQQQPRSSNGSGGGGGGGGGRRSK